MQLIDKTGVFNLAVLALGQTAPIVYADGDNTLTARVLRQWWEIALSKALARTDWRCFRKVGALSLMQGDYSDTWEFKYQIPNDAETILRVDFDNFFPNYDTRPERKLPFEMLYTGSDRSILSNVPFAWASYTARPAPGVGFPAYFAEVLALILAELAAPALITNNWARMKQVFLSDARQRISQAIATDLGQEPDRRAPRSSFADARRD